MSDKGQKSIYHQRVEKVRKGTNSKVSPKTRGVLSPGSYMISIIGVMIGIIVLQNFVPFLGYIPIQPFNPTIIHITVIVGAVLFGPVIGLVLGFVWGALCLVRAFVYPTNAIDSIFFVNPLVSVLPRVLIGFCSGWFFKWVERINHKSILNLVAVSILGSFINTVLVLGFIYLLYRDAYAVYYELNLEDVLHAILVVIGTNGVMEAVCAAVIVPLIARPLIVMRDR